ncbi:MAG: hypothetical protein JWP48_2947 [Actinoallomurus sp.]|nr:hypothetical protein [Actinoallomurus sp.]
MSIHRSRRIGPFTAQRLLRGETTGPDRLAELLATAVAPVARDGLVGEEAAISAFRDAHLAPAPQLRRQSVIKTALAKLLTIKVAAAALTATAAGGVALAAGTGHLPESVGGAAPTAQPAPTHGTGTHHTAKASAPRGGHSSAAPSPSLVGLCHAYRAGAGDNPGKALDNPAFTHLISVAGGKDKVVAYCTGLLKAHPGKARASHPAGAPSTHPTAASPTHPTSAPSTHPTKPTHPGH